MRHLIAIVDYSTFRRWVRKDDPQNVKTRKERPRISVVIREVILQLAQDTGWGYSRILGELRKLGLGRVSDGGPKTFSLSSQDSYSLYAMSDVLTVVPEPGTMVLAGLAAAVVAVHGWRRRSKNR